MVTQGAIQDDPSLFYVIDIAIFTPTFTHAQATQKT